MRRVFGPILVALTLAVATAGTAPPRAVADKKCARFTSSDGFKISVFVRGTSCRQGTTVLRKFLPRGGTNKRVLGWRCTTGTGGAFCHRGRKRIQTGRF